MKIAPNSCYRSVFIATFGRKETNRFSHVLWQVRDVKIGRLLITLCLETRIERLLERWLALVGEIGTAAELTLAKPTSYPSL